MANDIQLNASPQPPSHVIRDAELIARRSPCTKSKRGVIVFARGAKDDQVFVSVSEGWNSMPSGIRMFTNGGCDASEECRQHCSKRCVHAEMRALRDIPRRGFLAGMIQGLMASASGPGPEELIDVVLEMVHVKIDDVTGQVVAGGPPSCWQCSREIVDDGRIRYVWLYQHLLETVVRGVTESIRPTRMPSMKPAPEPKWCRYTAEQFHVETLRNCGLLSSPSHGRLPAYIGDA